MGSIDTSNINLEIKNENNNNLSNEVILAIDIGTTNLKCALYDENLEVLHSCSSRLEILQPRKGYLEVDPKYLLTQIKKDIKKCVDNKPGSFVVKSLGISTQRNSIILWNKLTGENYCNIILWNDKRSLDISNSMNKGVILNILKGASYVVSLAGTSIAGHRLKAFSNYQTETSHIAPKITSQLKLLENKLKPDEFNNIMFGTIETWLLWNITKEKKHATDITCASSTGMYDMYWKCWSSLLTVSLNIPKKLLPKVCDTCSEFGNLKPEILDLDYTIPITAVVADAQSSVIAECGFHKGDCVITLGTGSFISVNIGDKPLSSNNGFFSLNAFKRLEEEIFVLHASISSAGVAIDWAKSIELFKDYTEFNELLKSTSDSGGVYFIPAFGHINMTGVEHNANVGTGFIGIKSSTTKSEMLRAVIDSIVFTIKIKFDLLIKDLKTHKISLNSIKVCGGVAQSDFICQYLATLLNHTIERDNTSSSTSLYGAAFLSGLGSKTWKKLEDLKSLRKKTKIFIPESSFKKKNIKEWEVALDRYKEWY